MKKILFLIHDLGQGGAEKVLINLVNHMDRKKFEISVTVLFGGGVNEQFLAPDIHFKAVFPKMIPGNSKIMKLFTPKQLHKAFIKEHYDIEVAYLEGPSTRVISGCTDRTTKLVSWVHCTMKNQKVFSESYRGMAEAIECYNKFDLVTFVSEDIRNAFMRYAPEIHNTTVLYNTNDTSEIICKKDESVDKGIFSENEICICGVGKLVPLKGFDELLHIHNVLYNEGYPIHTYLLGDGPERGKLENYCKENGLENSVTLLGYQDNPYKFMNKCDIFVCSSLSEGFSTAATEALIVGTAVVSTPVSGMKEMLGSDNEHGIIAQDFDKALCKEIRRLLDSPQLLLHYKSVAKERGKLFCMEVTVQAVEDKLLEL